MTGTCSPALTSLWKPPLLSKLAAEDRCHLNGLAMKNGQPKYVTSVCQSDVADGWRNRRQDGGCVIDVTTISTIANPIVLALQVESSSQWF